MSGQGGQRMLEPRAAALRIAEILREHGHLAYFAGGCVRDRLFGIEPHDYDIATDAVPDRLKEIFPRARGVGAAFGVMLVPKGGRQVEVATFRSDGPYEDARHPTSVSFGSPEADALRRDFTVNGLFEMPQTGEIIDYVDGQADIKARVLRAIGDPDARLEEDHLRMLRAVRFAARFELEIESNTASAIASRASRLAGVSRERVGQELRRMLGAPSRSVAVSLIERFAMDFSVLGGRNAGERLRVDRLPVHAPWIDVLAAWLVDRDPEGSRLEARDLADRMVKQLVLSNQEREELFQLLEIRDVLLGEWAGMGVAARKRLAAREMFIRAVDLLAAGEPDAAEPVRSDYASLEADGLAPEPFLNGADLLEDGFSQGRELGRVLEQVFDAQLEGRISNREEALAMARALHGRP